MYSSTASYLFVAQCSRGFEGRCRAQTAERPGFADFWWFQGATTDGVKAAQMGQVCGGADYARWFAFYILHGTVTSKCVRITAHVQ